MTPRQDYAVSQLAANAIKYPPLYIPPRSRRNQQLAIDLSIFLRLRTPPPADPLAFEITAPIDYDDPSAFRAMLERLTEIEAATGATLTHRAGAPTFVTDEEIIAAMVNLMLD